MAEMIIVTGCAGFIGHALCLRLLARGELVIGLDNLNDYYDRSLKLARLETLKVSKNFFFMLADVADKTAVRNLFDGFQAKAVVHLAAQAGVRYSLESPQAYIDSNITGFLNILNACCAHNVEHLVYASSSSVYGLNEKQPFDITDRTDAPANLYAVTKKTNELMAHAYHHLYGLKSTGLRFFTVYGPWGRPDMALFKFARAILAGEPVDVYNNGNHARAFTYIDDIVEGILAVLDGEPKGCEVHNIGGAEPTGLLDMIDMLAGELVVLATLNMMPMQKGDVHSTIAAPSTIPGWAPKVSIQEGIHRFVKWYREYYDERNHLPN